MKIESLILLGVFALASSTIRAEPQAATTADPQSNVLPPTTSQRRLPAAAPVWETTKDVDVLIAAAQSRLKQEMLMEPPGDSVRDILMVLRHEAPERPEVQELAREVFKRMLQKGRAAMLAKAYERSAQMLQAAREIGAGLASKAPRWASPGCCVERSTWHR